MVREGAGRQGAVEVVLQQVALRASPLQLGLVFWVALPQIYGAGSDALIPQAAILSRISATTARQRGSALFWL